MESTTKITIILNTYTDQENHKFYWNIAHFSDIPKLRTKQRVDLPITLLIDL